MAKTYLESQEIHKLELAADNLRGRLLIRLLFHLGCRVSEALTLETRAIDFKSGTVTIQHLKSRLKLSCPGCHAHLGRNHAFCPKCGRKVTGAIAQAQEKHRRRILPLDQPTLKMLREYLRRGGAEEGQSDSYLRHQPPPGLADCQRVRRSREITGTGQSGVRSETILCFFPVTPGRFCHHGY